MLTVTLVLIGFIAGVYAGRERARGNTWYWIVSDFVETILGKVVGTWKWTMSLFKKGDSADSDEIVA